MIVHAMMGDPNASIPTPQPVHARPMFASYGRAIGASCISFVSAAAIEDGIVERLRLDRMGLPVRNPRAICTAPRKLTDAQIGRARCRERVVLTVTRREG